MKGRGRGVCRNHTSTASQYALLSLQAAGLNPKAVATHLFKHPPKLARQQLALGGVRGRLWSPQPARRQTHPDFQDNKGAIWFFFGEALLTREVDKMVQKVVFERFNGTAPDTLSALHDLLEAPFKFIAVIAGFYEG